MPAHGLAKLIERLHPGVSVRQLTTRANVPTERVAHYLRPGGVYTRLPPPETMREIARMLGCSLVEVVHAFNDSLDEPLPLIDLPEDEAALLRQYRGLAPGERERLRAGAELHENEALMLARFRALSPREQTTLLAITQTILATSDDGDRSADVAPPANLTGPRRAAGL